MRTATGKLQRWLASNISVPESPMHSRSMAARRRSRSWSSDPTFNLNALKPESIARRQIPHLLIVVTHPSDGGVVSGIATVQNRHTRVATGQLVLQQFNCISFAQDLVEIAQVQQTNDLVRSEIKEQLPKRFAAAFGPKVETSISDRGEGEVHNTL